MLAIERTGGILSCVQWKGKMMKFGLERRIAKVSRQLALA